jgi:hypothetical protein
MEELNALAYSIVNSSGRNTLSKTKIWKFYDRDNCLKSLHLKQDIYDVDIINRENMRREKVQQNNIKFYVLNNEYTQVEYINNINEWLDNNLCFIKQSNNNYTKSLDIINYITLELGNYNYSTIHEVGWSLKDVYRLNIDLYSTTIKLNYKNKDNILTEQKLKNFIEKNKKIIFQVKEKRYKKHFENIKTRENEQLSTQIQNIDIHDLEHDATRKVGSRNKCSSFIIQRTFKERYETQTCKKFPVKYAWEM